MLDVGFDAANAGTKGSDDSARILSGLFPEAQTLALRVYGRAYRDALDKATKEFADPGTAFDNPSSEFNGLKSECDGCGLSYRDLKVTTKKQGSQTYAVISGLTVVAKFQSCVYYDFGSTFDGGNGTGANDFSPGVDNFGSGSNDSGSGSPGSGVATTTVSWDGHCLTNHNDDPIYATMGDTGDEKPACLDAASGPDSLNARDFGITDVHLVVKEERGGWVIDPVATLFDYGRTALSHLNDPR